MLRVLATWDPEVLPSVYDSTDLESAALLGILPGVDASDWFAPCFDPLQNPEYLEETSAFRESVDGIQCRRHPEALLRDSPRLWDVVGKWRSGVARELSRGDYEALSNFEIECWLTMVSACSREEIRRMKRGHDGSASSDQD